MVAPLGPEDHVRGEGVETIVYADLCCPRCAAVWPLLGALDARLVFRHFPIASRHPRSPALHAAAEAAGAQGAFFEMVEALFGDQGRIDDPHLWQRAERLGLDLERFETDRRSPEVEARLRRDLDSGMRAGVADTLAIFRDGRPVDLETLQRDG